MKNGTDPKKTVKEKIDEKNGKKDFDRGQQLSDKYAQLVATKKMTYEQAMKKQKAQDAIVSKIKEVGTQTRGSSQNLPSKTEYKTARFKLDNQGNKIAY